MLAEYDVGPHSDSCRSSAAVLRRGAGCPHTRASRDGRGGKPEDTAARCESTGIWCPSVARGRSQSRSRLPAFEDDKEKIKEWRQARHRTLFKVTVL